MALSRGNELDNLGQWVHGWLSRDQRPVASFQIEKLLLTPKVSAQVAGVVSGCARRKQELFDLESRH